MLSSFKARFIAVGALLLLTLAFLPGTARNASATTQSIVLASGVSAVTAPGGVVDGTHPAYGVIPGTTWIAAAGATGTEDSFSVNFTLPNTFLDAQLNGLFFADNWATVWLNGVLINSAQPVGDLSANYGAGGASPTPFNATTGLVAGVNVLTFKVSNAVVGDTAGTTTPPTGANPEALDFIATVTYTPKWSGTVRSMGYYKNHRESAPSLCQTILVDSTRPSPNNTAPPPTTANVLPGVSYVVTASGTYDANAGITADAMYSSTNGSAWTDLVQAPYQPPAYSATLLDLQIDGSTPAWGAYNSNHIYTVTVSGPADGTLSFQLNDINDNNTGALSVTLCPALTSARIFYAIENYSLNAWTKFQAQYGVTLFNLEADPTLATAVFHSSGALPAFDGQTVGQLVALGATYTGATPSATLLALKDAFDAINNGKYIWQP